MHDLVILRQQRKVVADIVLKNKDNIVGFLDDNTELEESFAGFPVLGTTDQYQKYSDLLK